MTKRSRRSHAADQPRPTPSQARRLRDDQLRRALDLAATLPASEGVVIEATDGERIGTIRAALAAILRAEPRDLTWGVRGDRIVITKGELPPRR